LLFCGLYRVHVQGIAPDIAESEMESLGFDGGHRRHRILQATFRTLARAALSDATASR